MSEYVSLYVCVCRYVWEHLEVGYVQGMCDLVAPLLVIFDEGLYLTWLMVRN